MTRQRIGLPVRRRKDQELGRAIARITVVAGKCGMVHDGPAARTRLPIDHVIHHHISRRLVDEPLAGVVHVDQPAGNVGLRLFREAGGKQRLSIPFTHDRGTGAFADDMAVAGVFIDADIEVPVGPMLRSIGEKALQHRKIVAEPARRDDDRARAHFGVSHANAAHRVAITEQGIHPRIERNLQPA